MKNVSYKQAIHHIYTTTQEQNYAMTRQPGGAHFLSLLLHQETIGDSPPRHLFQINQKQTPIVYGFTLQPHGITILSNLFLGPLFCL